MSLILSSIYAHFNTLKKKTLGIHCGKRWHCSEWAVAFFHNGFYEICILKSCNSHISVVVCSFFEFGTVSDWCIREWVNRVMCYKDSSPNNRILNQIEDIYRPQINPFPNKPCFLHVYCTSLLKILWVKEKLLIMSNFSFSHGVFYLFR